MTIIFNIFVFYTLFNQINCRVIDDSFNIFIRIARSLLFPLICLTEMALQVIIIFIGKSPFHIVNEGLTAKQWGICIGFSAITFVVSIIVKLISIEDLIDNFVSKLDEEGDKVEKKEESPGNDDIKEIKNIENTKEKTKIKIEKYDDINDDNKKEEDYLNLNLNTQGGIRKSPIKNDKQKM